MALEFPFLTAEDAEKTSELKPLRSQRPRRFNVFAFVNDLMIDVIDWVASEAHVKSNSVAAVFQERISKRIPNLV